MALSVNKDLTLTAIFAGMAALLAELERISAMISSNLAQSPYLAIFNELKIEVSVIIALLLFSQSNVFKSIVSSYDRARLNWIGRKMRINTYRPIYVEELIFLILVATLFVVSTVYVTDRVRNSYSRYGLIYIARATCKGEFDRALARTEIIKNNPLWSRYQAELIESVPRLKYLAAQQQSEVIALRKMIAGVSAAEKLSLLAGAKATFGAAGVERYLDESSEIEVGSDPVLQQWQRYLAEDTCE